MNTLIVKTIEDLPKFIPFGTPIVVDVFADGSEEDQTPTEAMFDLEAKIFEEIQNRIVKYNEVNVEFENGFAVIYAVYDTVAELSGDIRDRNVQFRAGETKKYKLTNEGNGYITVNGVKYMNGVA